MELDDYAAFRAVDEERGRLAAARKAHAERMKPIRQERERLEAEWSKAVDDAVRKGEKPPEKPTVDVDPHDDYAEAGTFMPWEQRIQEDERRALAEIRPQVEQDARKAEHDLFVKARPLVQKLEALVAEERHVLDILRRVRNADRDSGETHGRLDLAMLVNAVRNGRSLIQLQRDDAPRRAVIIPTVPEDPETGRPMPEEIEA